jgi:hypothetical protein
MTRIQSLPYLTPAPGRMMLGNWQIVRNKIAAPLSELLPDWDPAVSIQATVSVQVDLDGILSDCNLASDASLRLAAAWYCPGTVLRGCGDRVDLNKANTSKNIELCTEVEGINLAKAAEFSVRLVLLHHGADVKKFAPKLPGSILAQSNPYRVIIEGEGPRFPIEVIDFSDTYFATNAGWVLRWDPQDLHQTVLGDIRLYINSQHERVKRAVSENLLEDFDIREAVRYDVARTLIYGALSRDEFVADPDAFEDGSIGAATRNMLRVYFPEFSFSELRDRIQRPESFDPRLQEKLRLFWREE